MSKEIVGNKKWIIGWTYGNSSQSYKCKQNSKLPRQQTRWDLVYVTPIKSLSRNLVRVVQFKIHSSFRTEVRPRNPHTLIPKLALVDTVETPVARVWIGQAKRGKFGKDIIWKCLGIFSMRGNWNLAKTKFGIVLEQFRSFQRKRRVSKVRREEKFEVRSKRVSPRVIRQVSGSEQLKIVAERWVFILRLVTWPGHVIEHVGHVANRKIPLGWANYNLQLQITITNCAISTE